MDSDISLPEYVTTFHAEEENGNWKAWMQFNGKRINERYCLNKSHAERTRTALVNAFWGFKLN